jgi:hypothetical protein
VHGDVPVTGSAHGGEDEEKAAFGDRAADGIAPVGDEEAVFDEFPRNELFHASGEISDVAELAGLSDGKILGKGWASPGTEEDLGPVLLEDGFPGSGIGQGKGNWDLMEGEGVEFGLDRGGEKVLGLVRGKWLKNHGQGHLVIMQEVAERSRQTGEKGCLLRGGKKVNQLTLLSSR